MPWTTIPHMRNWLKSLGCENVSVIRLLAGMLFFFFFVLLWFELGNDNCAGIGRCAQTIDRFLNWVKCDEKLCCCFLRMKSNIFVRTLISWWMFITLVRWLVYTGDSIKCYDYHCVIDALTIEIITRNLSGAK